MMSLANSHSDSKEIVIKNKPFTQCSYIEALRELKKKLSSDSFGLQLGVNSDSFLSSLVTSCNKLQSLVLICNHC